MFYPILRTRYAIELSLLLVGAAACGRKTEQREACPPPSLAARSAPPSVSLDDCLRDTAAPGAQPRSAPILDASAGGDPHGNGPVLLGFGFKFMPTTTLAPPRWVPVDRFDVARITRANGDPIERVVIQAHALVGHAPGSATPLPGAEWAGAWLIGKVRCTNPQLAPGTTSEVRVQLRGASAAAPDHRTWTGYRTEIEREDGTHLVNTCIDPDDVAFPIQGYWRPDGTYDRDPATFSLACTRRDVAICLGEGFPDDLPASDPRAKLLEACTRMMRADYCGDGGSYTRGGTYVRIFDDRGLASHVDRPPFAFEAAWDENGAACIARSRWIDDPPPCMPGAALGTRAEAGQKEHEAQPRSRRVIPSCSDANAAAALLHKPFVFNESCEHHACSVTFTEPIEERITPPSVRPPDIPMQVAKQP
jgi:hypothetical protein